MPILGAHMSIAGGYYKAVELAHQAGCDCVQLFTKNNNQWRAKELTDEDARLFQDALGRLGVSHPTSHVSYLINLGSPDPELWKKSLDSFVVELLRAERLGIPYVVAHPGAFVSDDEAAGLRRIVAGLDEAHAQTAGLQAKCLLETTAGQGSCLGWRFEHLAEIVDRARDPERLGVCFDTCHVYAAGYELTNEKDYLATMAEFDRTVGLALIKAFHLNDSKRERGSRVDRHAHIGEGHLGREAFRLLLNDSRFRQVPMYLETAKGERDGEDLDVVNLRVLRGLVDGDAAPASKRTAKKAAQP